MKPYEGKHVWIIGASSGIGHALAVELAKQGATLALSARRKSKLEELCTQLEGNGHIVIPADVSDEQSIKDAQNDIVETFGKLNSTVYLAALYRSEEENNKELAFIHKSLDVNIGGVFNMLDSLIPYYKNQGTGQVAICASVAGYRGLPKAQPYCATKAALISICETLRIDLADTDIDIKVINPGFVKTPLTDKNDFPMPMMIEAEDAAKIISKDLLTSKFEIHFPKKFTFIMKLLRILPNSLYLHLAKKMV